MMQTRYEAFVEMQRKQRGDYVRNPTERKTKQHHGLLSDTRAPTSL